MSGLQYRYQVPGDDFSRAGEVSSTVKGLLKRLGLDPEVIRKVAIALYEGEINMVIHGGGGQIALDIQPELLTAVLTDQGPGIPDVEKAMEEGWTTASDQVRDMGFGAGMGLPNMKKYADRLRVDSTVGVGTVVTIQVDLPA